MMINGNKRSLIITTAVGSMINVAIKMIFLFHDWLRKHHRTWIAASAFSYAPFFPTDSFLFSQPLFFSNGGSTEAEINKKIKRMSNQVSECLSTRDVAR